MGAKIQILSIPFFYYIWKKFNNEKDIHKTCFFRRFGTFIILHSDFSNKPTAVKTGCSETIQRGGQCRNRNPKISKTSPKRKQKHHLAGGRKLVHLVLEI